MNELIGIIGKGIVGSAIYNGLTNNNYNVSFYDPNIRDTESLDFVVNNSHILFICVSTPSKDDGSIDLSIINSVIDDIMNMLHSSSNKLIIIKSTVVPGTTESYYNKYCKLYNNVKFIYCPEFLDEYTAYNDFINSHKVVIGHTGNSAEVYGSILVKLFTNFTDKDSIYNITSTEAEMVKYTTNSYYAMKVVFANTIYEICQKLEINYNNVNNVFTDNPRIGNSHFKIFHKSGRGAGGKCLPKDLSALVDMSGKLDTKYNILPYIQKLNNRLLKDSNKI